jgi:hypothetical protein
VLRFSSVRLVTVVLKSENFEREREAANLTILLKLVVHQFCEEEKSSTIVLADYRGEP